MLAKTNLISKHKTEESDASIRPAGVPQRIIKGGKRMSVRCFMGIVLLFNILAIGAGVIHYIFGKVNYFKEGAFLTIFSVVQLLLISRLAYKTHRVRGDTKQKINWKEASAIWAIIALGFGFLAADELFTLHEHMDTLIHMLFGMKQTAITARIDDVLVGLYGVAGISVLYVYRTELKNYKDAIPYLVAGFVLLFIMVALDVLTHRDDILRLIYEYDRARFIRDWLGKAEEAFKLFAEGFYLIAFYAILKKAGQMGGNAEQSASPANST